MKSNVTNIAFTIPISAAVMALLTLPHVPSRLQTPERQSEFWLQG